MRIRLGGPIALTLLGLIIYVALNVSSQYANLKLIGLILAVGGAVWLILTIYANRRKPGDSVREYHHIDE